MKSQLVRATTFRTIDSTGTQSWAIDTYKVIDGQCALVEVFQCRHGNGNGFREWEAVFPEDGEVWWSGATTFYTGWDDPAIDWIPLQDLSKLVSENGKLLYEEIKLVE